jgi:hypothetical protein
VRLLSADGVYPQSPLVLEDHALVAADDEFAWSAVSNPQLADEPDGEVSWLSPDEILFFGALTLAEAHPRTNGRLRVCTRSYAAELELPDDHPFPASEFLRRSRDVAAALRLSTIEPGGERVLSPDSRQRPERTRRDYTLRVRRLLEAMPKEEPLLFRGLYKLLIASELQRYQQFLEESALAAFISREAALELLRRQLSAKVGSRLKREDVLTHIEESFPTGRPFVEVLRSDWEARVMMVHPVSDYGENWTPAVDTDECYESLDTAIHLFRYLVLGKVWTPGKWD